MERPTISNAPGLVLRRRKDHWVAEWHCRSDLYRRGFRPGSIPLWRGEQPTEKQAAFIADRCQLFQSEMLVWGRGGVPTVCTLDGTLCSLIARFQTDEDSPYKKLRYHTRINYDHLCDRIERDHGAVLLADIKARMFLRWHEAWMEGGHVTQAHSLMGMLRGLFKFGRTIMADEDLALGGHCVRLGMVLHDMRFKAPAERREELTAEQAVAVREMAHKMGRSSIALAQAFQFECLLRQRDVIGEWVPISEEGTSDVIHGNEKWLRGNRWSEIENLILTHVTSKRGKKVEIDLRLAPMVMEELGRLPSIPTSGPIVVCEKNGVPWGDHSFRRAWRRVATAAGVPAQVYNMDSRAGGITEASDAGARLEHIRHAATHSDIKMTMRYSRNARRKTAKVMQMRSRYRDGTSGEPDMADRSDGDE